jgi:hypothetical protein
LAPSPIPFVNGLRSDRTQTMVAIMVHLSRAQTGRRSRIASRPQPAKTTTEIAPMRWIPPCRASVAWWHHSAGAQVLAASAGKLPQGDPKSARSRLWSVVEIGAAT